MAKPTIVTRASKGSALTWTEGDTNLTNLRDATISIGGDSGLATPVELNGSFTISGGTGLSSSSSTNQVTINLDNTAVAAGSYTNANITVDAQGRLTSASNGSAGMTSFTVAGDSGSSQSIGNSDTLTISGGTGLSSVASATDTITINLDNTAVAAGSYTYASITVDAQGRITSASNGTTPLVSGGALGTPSSGTLTNCTVNGTDPIGYRDLPAVGAKNTSYTLQTADVGKYVEVTSGGSITIPNSTFAAGDVIVIANNHTAAITITCSITDAYIGGTDTDKATVSLATRGVANIFFLSATRCIITGNVS